MDTLLAFDTKTYMPLSNNKQGLIACVWTSTCGLIKWSYQGGGLYFLFIFYFFTGSNRFGIIFTNFRVHGAFFFKHTLIPESRRVIDPRPL